MVEEDRDPLNKVLGSNKARYFRYLEDDSKKEVIESILLKIKDMFPSLNWSGLRIESSNAGIEVLKKNLEDLDLERLRISLDLEGFEGIPDQWLEFANFLIKLQRGKIHECNNLLGDLARMILFKLSGFGSDKDFIRTFYKVPVNQLLKFFKKFKVVQTA